MGFVATRNINIGAYDKGDPIDTSDFSERALDQLLDLGAIEHDGKEDAGAAEKPLAKMNKAELTAVAKAEGVEIPAGATNAAIVTAIEAKRKPAE